MSMIFQVYGRVDGFGGARSRYGAVVSVLVRPMGAFSAEVDGRIVDQDHFQRRNAAAVVKVLALAPNHRMHRELLQRYAAAAPAGIGPSSGSEAGDEFDRLGVSSSAVSTRGTGSRCVCAAPSRVLGDPGGTAYRDAAPVGYGAGMTDPPSGSGGPVVTPRLARAVVLERFGEPLAVREFPVSPPGAGEMTVRVRYGGVCGTDLHLRQGHLPIPTPLVLGHEGLGLVDEIGARAGVDALGRPLAPGDAVMWASSIACGHCVACRQYREPTLCEHRRTYGVNRPTTQEPALSGAWADSIHLREGTTVIAVPHGVDHVGAMAFACAGPTMVHALYERRPVRVGEIVVVQGSGPVGLAAAALAQLAGAARVILVGGPGGRLELAAAAGIGDAHVNLVEAAVPREALERVRQFTGGRGADLVIECTGVPSAVAQGLHLARRGGSYLVVGQYTDAGDTAVNPHQIVYRQLDVVGSWAFTGAHLVEYVRLLPQLAARFDLPTLTTTYPLEETAQALAEVAAGRVMKAILAAGAAS
jgi:threonine dehydrogenase-like Zn-dependent dehydrogenase